MRFLKIKLITVALILALTPVAARAATEFVSIVDKDDGSGTDYTTLSAWETGNQTDLTAAATQMFSGTKTGTLSDNATVYLCRSGSSFSDNFSTDPSSRWAAQYGSMSWGSGAYSTNSSATGAYTVYNTSTGGTTQYAKIKMITAGRAGVALRGTGTASDGFYYLDAYPTGNVLGRYNNTGWLADITDNGTLTWTTNDVMAVTVSGTGASTSFKIWKNPSNNTPYDASNWDSSSDAADLTLTASGGTYYNNGTYVGIGYGGANIAMDDFYGGSITTYQSHSGTVVHANAAGNQILIESITGSATETANDFWNSSSTCTSPTNYFTVTGSQAGGDSAIAVASARSSSGTADTTAVIIDGWTTSAANYIKIWTDPATGARHNGKWDTSKYRLELRDDSLNQLLDISESYVRIIGLQLKIKTAASMYNAQSAIATPGGTIASSNLLVFSDNIITNEDTGTTYSNTGLRLEEYDPYINAQVYNNIFHDFNTSTSSIAMNLPSASISTAYIYNNTFHNSDTCLSRGSGTVVAKNNLFKSCATAASGTFAAGSGYNATDNASIGYTVTGGAVGDRTSQTFSFIDEANDDFHLSPSDTAAKNAGTNLQSDGSLPFSQDIDGSYRGNVWDIGADEVATEFVSTVMQSGGNYATLSAWEADVNSDLTAAATRVYSGSLTGSISDNATVTLYRGGASQSITASVTAKTATQILLRSISGTTPLNVQANDEWRVDASNLWTVTGTLDSLGASPIAVAKIDGAWTSADTTAVTINDWTTSADNYIKIYTTTAARHNGKWDVNKYRLAVGHSDGIIINEDFVRIDGLQISLNLDYASDKSGVILTGSASGADFQLSNNIIKEASASYAGGGVKYEYLNGTTSRTAKIWNNLIYDFNTSSGYGYGLYPNDTDWTIYFYNNTIQNCTYGISSDNVIAKNNIVKGSGSTNAYVGTFASGTDYNATDGTDAIGQGSNNKTSQTFTFVDETNDDFHLAQADTAAQNAGTDLSADANLAFSTDIEGQTRPNPDGSIWDIGADEYYPATPIYRSVGPGATTALATGTGNNLTISGSTATFATAPGDNIGVGDALEYDSDNDGDIDANDSIAFITARTDSTHYTVQAASGGTPTTIQESISAVEVDSYSETNQSDVAWMGPGYRTRVGQSFQMDGVGGTLDSVKFYLQKNGTPSGSIVARVYAHTGTFGVSSLPTGAILATSDAVTATSLGTSLGLITLNFSGANRITLSASAYYSVELYYAGTDGGVRMGTDESSPTYAGNNYHNYSGDMTYEATIDVPFYIYRSVSSFTDQDWSIFRAYSSLYAAERGDENDGLDNDLEDFDNWDGTGDYTDTDEVGRDLVANNEQWNIAAYASATADTTAVVIDGWTTGPTNYINIYTPVSATEVGTSQRHPGKWDTNFYRIATATGIPMTVSEENTRIIGLQINSADNDGVYINGITGTAEIFFSENIIKGNSTASKRGINLGSAGTSSKAKISNNIIYDYTASGTGVGIYWNDADWTPYIYNNTVKDNAVGLDRGNDTAQYTKNNLIDATNAFNGTFTDNDSNNDYNAISENTNDVAIGSHGKYNQTFSFVDSSGDDFHLSPSDTGAKNFGVDLSNDANLSFSTDIDGQSRLTVGSWDIGADEEKGPTGQSVNVKPNVNLKPGTRLHGGE